MSTFDLRVLAAEAKAFVDGAQAVIEQDVYSLTDVGVVKTYPMGSYRRALAGEHTDVGDVDLLVTCPQGEVLSSLKDLTLPDWLKATEKKAFGWMQAPAEGTGTVDRMMIDGWLCPWESRGPFALFLTGPAEWNVWMRQRTTAARPDLMLTQYGLFTAVSKPTKTYPDRKVVGERVDVTDEGADVEEAERLFWHQWCQAVGRPDAPFRGPHERRLR